MALTNRYTDLDTCLDDYVTWYCAQQIRIQGFESCLQFLKLALDGRLFIIHMMRNQLVALRDSRTDVDRFDAALDEFTTWYATHSERLSDPVQTVKFLKRSTDDTLHLLHMLRDQLAQANQRAIRESALWLPSHLARA